MKSLVKALFLSFSLLLCPLAPVHAVTLEGLEEVAKQFVASLPEAGTHPEFHSSHASNNEGITEVECFIRVPIDSLESIYRFGLVNQYQSRQSKGTYEPARRLKNELLLSGCKPDCLPSAEPSEHFPVYGFLNFKTQKGTKTPSFDATTAFSYGPVTLVFDPSTYSSMTYTLGDSLAVPTPFIPLSNLSPLSTYCKQWDPLNPKHYPYIEIQKWGPKGRKITRENIKEISIPNYLLANLDSNTQQILERIHRETGIPLTTYKSQVVENEAYQARRTAYTLVGDQQALSELKLPDLTPATGILQSHLAFHRDKAQELSEKNPELKRSAEILHATKRNSLIDFGLSNSHYPKMTAAVLYAVFSDPDDRGWLEDDHIEQLLFYFEDTDRRNAVFSALRTYYSHSNKIIKQIKIAKKPGTQLYALIKLLRELDSSSDKESEVDSPHFTLQISEHVFEQVSGQQAEALVPEIKLREFLPSL